MKKTVLVALALICTSVSAQTQTFSSEELARRTIERRAVEAAIWGMPLVAMDAVRQGFLRDMGAKYNDIVYYSKPADWKFQTTTPNASTHYVYSAYDTRRDGPIVLEVPPAVGAGLYGQLCDMWDVPLAIVVLTARIREKVGNTSFCRPIIKATPRKATFWSANRPTVASG